MSQLKRFAVSTVKPRIGDTAWQRLRLIAGAPLPRAPRAAAKPKPATTSAAKSSTLTELGRKFKTDKVSSHRYTEHYERHLQHLRNTPFTLLEIGIGGYSRERQGGASLRMWKAFFGRAQIVGLDIEDKSFVDEERIQTVMGSQVDEAVLSRIVDGRTDLDVIIDDGSHRPSHVRTTFRLLFPHVRDGGFYIIEDTQTSYWPERGGSVDRNDPKTSMALVKDLIDGLNYEEFVDEDYDPTYTDLNVLAVYCYHNLVFIQKGRNAEGTAKRKLLKRRYAAAAEVPQRD